MPSTSSGLDHLSVECFYPSVRFILFLETNVNLFYSRVAQYSPVVSLAFLQCATTLSILTKNYLFKIVLLGRIKGFNIEDMV